MKGGKIKVTNSTAVRQDDRNTNSTSTLFGLRKRYAQVICEAGGTSATVSTSGHVILRYATHHGIPQAGTLLCESTDSHGEHSAEIGRVSNVATSRDRNSHVDHGG